MSFCPRCSQNIAHCAQYCSGCGFLLYPPKKRMLSREAFLVLAIGAQFGVAIGMLFGQAGALVSIAMQASVGFFLFRMLFEA